MRLTVHIPVSNWMKRFLIEEYGSRYYLKTCDPLGAMIFSNLRTITNVKPSLPSKSETAYEVEIPKSYFDRYGLQTIDHRVSGYIARFFEHLFNRKLEIWIESRKTIRDDDKFKKILLANKIYLKLSNKNAIMDFLSYYNIQEEELTIETLRRRYNDLQEQRRKRQKVEKK